MWYCLTFRPWGEKKEPIPESRPATNKSNSSLPKTWKNTSPICADCQIRLRDLCIWINRVHFQAKDMKTWFPSIHPKHKCRGERPPDKTKPALFTDHNSENSWNNDLASVQAKTFVQLFWNKCERIKQSSRCWCYSRTCLFACLLPFKWGHLRAFRVFPLVKAAEHKDLLEQSGFSSHRAWDHEIMMCVWLDVLSFGVLSQVSSLRF